MSRWSTEVSPVLSRVFRRNAQKDRDRSVIDLRRDRPALVKLRLPVRIYIGSVGHGREGFQIDLVASETQDQSGERPVRSLILAEVAFEAACGGRIGIRGERAGHRQKRQHAEHRNNRCGHPVK